MIPKSKVPFGATGATHRHYKGGWYRLLFYANHTETGESLVIYQFVWSEANPLPEQKYYARPHALFFDFAAGGQKRFEAVEP